MRNAYFVASLNGGYWGPEFRLCDLLGSAVSEAVDDWGSAGRGALVGHATERIGAL